MPRSPRSSDPAGPLTAAVGRAFFCAAWWVLSAASAADNLRPYTVDDMLQTEQFGRMLFTPDGDALLFERLGPFEAQPVFGRADAHRPEAFFARSDGKGEARRLADDPAARYELLGFSPDGSLLAFRNAAHDGEQLGVLAMDDGTTRIFDLPPEYFVEASWLGDLLVYPALTDGESRFTYGMHVERLQALADRWKAARDGEISTASVLTSGGSGSPVTSSDALVRAHPDTGRVEVLAAGRHVDLRVSPDARIVAALRQDSVTPDPGLPIEHGVNTGGVLHTLTVHVLRQPDVTVATPCEGCDVLPGSMRWSSDSRRLVFVARKRTSDWGTAAYYVYDSETSRTKLAPLGALTPQFGTAGSRAPAGLEAAWFGNRLAVVASAGNTARPDWYLMGGEREVNLTQQFEQGLPELVSASDRGGLFLHSGKAWLVDGDGKPRDLALVPGVQLAPWPDEPYLPRQLQTGETVILQTRNEDTGSRLLFVDLETGEVDTVRASSAQARFAAASPRRRLAAIVEPVGNASVLSIGAAGAEPQPIAKINSHLDAVRGGTPQRIDHDGPDGSRRHSWLLLPPGYRNDSPLPTIVNVYPGRVGGASYRFHTLERASALNDHMLAARGYAVLYPSLPSEGGRGLRDPLEGLERDVFAAVDAAVAEGYVDADRLAVQGQSYGGYAAAALIGLTDRFKAAVASAGMYNLVSFYGVFDPRAWQHAETRGLRMFGASWLETGVGRIGAPPWRVPERYLRNSPLMHIESVTTPVMLIHGDRDFVSITQAEEYFTALTRLNKEATFIRYIGEGHVPYSPANMRDLWQRLYGWFEEHLGAPYPVMQEP